MRFDNFIAKRLKISRNKAQELIEKKEILLNGVLFKPSFELENLFKIKPSEDEILSSKALNLELLGEFYVSRAAFKLKDFLKNIDIKIEQKICLDIGAAAGGFTQILLENGAKSVFTLDVGNSQLHLSLRENPRVKMLENTDLRDFKSDEKFELITCDVSFISLLNLLFYIDKLALRDIILLFKPQFEVGRKIKRDKKGVIKDENAVFLARQNFEKECAKIGWILCFSQICALKGKDGNKEYFYHYKKLV